MLPDSVFSVARARVCDLRRCKFARSAAFSAASRFSAAVWRGEFCPDCLSDRFIGKFITTQVPCGPVRACEFRFFRYNAALQRCCSSEVEHSLGKGEVGSSILPSSTILPLLIMCARQFGSCGMMLGIRQLRQNRESRFRYLCVAAPCHFRNPVPGDTCTDVRADAAA